MAPPPVLQVVEDDAGAPVGDLEAMPLDDTFMIRTDQIDVGERLRDIDPVWAHALGAMMVRDRQRTAIEVCRLPGSKRWLLVSGGHRLTGALHVGMEYLRAQVVSANRNERRLSEVLENIARRDLDPIDRAASIAELVTLHKVRAGIDPLKDGRATSAVIRWQKAVKNEAADANATIAVAYGWADGVAEQLGMSRRTIENDLLLYRRLAPSLVDMLRKARHPVATNATQLRQLAKLEEYEQREIVEYLLWSGKSLGRPMPKTVADALAMWRGSNRAIDPEAKRLSTFLATFGRMGLAEKKGALAQLAGMLPAGFKLVEAGADLVEVSNIEFEADPLEPAPLTPAVPIHKSVRAEYIACLECGEKHGQLASHLRRKHELTADGYREKWRLPLDYPMTAPDVAEKRRDLARKIGLKGDRA